MEKFTIFKNKGELFKCNLDIEGADLDKTKVRLCLEFDDNKNLFFYGKVNNEGHCTIEIPVIDDVQQETGTLAIEVVADDMFFRLYECEVDLRTSIDVKMARQEEWGKTAKKVAMTGLMQERGQSHDDLRTMEQIAELEQEVEKLEKLEAQAKKKPQIKENKNTGLPKFDDFLRKKK